jgi:hypothetical protein
VTIRFALFSRDHHGTPRDRDNRAEAQHRSVLTPAAVQTPQLTVTGMTAAELPPRPRRVAEI